MPFKIAGLVLEVQQCPELKAGIGDRQLDTVIARLLASVRQVRMLVDIEDTPDFVVGQEGISLAPRLPRRLFFALGGALDQGLRYAGAVVDLHLDKSVSEYQAQGTEVARLRAASFAQDKNALARLAPRPAAP